MIRRKRKQYVRNKYILFSFVIITIFIGAISTKFYMDNKREKQEIESGYLALKGLETKDVKTIENEVFASNEKKEPEEKELEKKETNLKKDVNLSNKEYFKNSIFMGDSITEAIGFYKILDASQVVAKKGQNVINAKESVGKIREKQPTELFILYGMNDLEIFKSPSEFIKEYTTLTSSLKETCPNTKIYVQSILPTSSKVKNSALSKQRVYEFNKAIEEMCKNIGINYINIASTIEGKEDFYDRDGIHPKASYYNELLQYIKNNI